MQNQSPKLGGPLPESIGNLSALQTLNLAWNQFTGPIPSSYSGLKKLKHLSLNMNELNGSIPSDLGDSKPHLVSVNLAGNQFDEAPEYIGACGSVSKFKIASMGVDGGFIFHCLIHRR